MCLQPTALDKPLPYFIGTVKPFVCILEVVCVEGIGERMKLFDRGFVVFLEGVGEGNFPGESGVYRVRVARFDLRLCGPLRRARSWFLV